MRQGSFQNVDGVARPLATEVAKARAKAMRGADTTALRIRKAGGLLLAGLFLLSHASDMQPADNLAHAVDADLPAIVAGEYQVARFPRQLFQHGDGSGGQRHAMVAACLGALLRYRPGAGLEVDF